MTPAIVDSTRHEGKYLSLTFDDGPGPVNTPKLLAVLEKHHVKATLCLWGHHVKQYPEMLAELRTQATCCATTRCTTTI